MDMHNSTTHRPHPMIGISVSFPGCQQDVSQIATKECLSSRVVVHWLRRMLGHAMLGQLFHHLRTGIAQELWWASCEVYPWRANACQAREVKVEIVPKGADDVFFRDSPCLGLRKHQKPWLRTAQGPLAIANPRKKHQDSNLNSTDHGSGIKIADSCEVWPHSLRSTTRFPVF